MVQIPKRIRLVHDVYGDQEAVFHIVFRAAISEKPFVGAPICNAIWELVTNEHARGKVRIYAACLMADHLHLVVAPRNRDLIKWVNGFKSYSTRIAQQFRRERILWQPGFFDRRLRDDNEFAAAIEYVIRNPVDAGLVNAASDWHWVGAWVEDEV